MSAPASPTQQHRREAPKSAACAVITVSDTRTIETDRGGTLLCDMLRSAGHTVIVREIVPDEPSVMRPLIESLAARDEVQAILLTGGTGVSSRDQTYETVSALLDKPLPGYGELFRMLSYQEIGAAAMLGRAVGGVYRRKIVLTMPGSPAAVSLAMDRLIVPELGHLIREATR